MRNPNLINAGSERTNLFFAVHSTVNNDAKLARLTQMIAQEEGSGIVYTASIKSANDLHERFTEAGISVGRYHGKMGKRDREQAQRDFMNDTYKVMIATKAFGLGIDKPNIRFVFHYEFPDSLHPYYQQAGRAGRDGKDSTAVLLFRLEDKRIQSFFSAGRYPKAEEVKKVLEALAASEAVNAAQLAEQSGVGQRRTEVILYLLRETKMVRRGRSGYVLRNAEPVTDAHIEELLAEYTHRAGIDRNRLDDMMRYAESMQCRRRIFREYFNEPAGEPCGKCDNCVNRTGETRGTVDVHAAAEDHGVIRVETLVGTIVTTAPETLPKHEVPKFAANDKVTHKRFGKGIVQDVSGDTLLVRFDTAGTKKLKADFVKKV